MTNPNDLAFPLLSSTVEGQIGLNKREYIAIQALAGLLFRGCPGRLAAGEAVKAADFLVEALNQQEEGQP
jgi:hypothetical protein